MRAPPVGRSCVASASSSFNRSPVSGSDIPVAVPRMREPTGRCSRIHCAVRSCAVGRCALTISQTEAKTGETMQRSANDPCTTSRFHGTRDRAELSASSPAPAQRQRAGTSGRTKPNWARDAAKVGTA